ncbi:MAG: thermosome subunit [Candidatus Altiarchaeales archaeon]|nr:thermosome subunit [Candidatus Altiarchaeales archaeon]
MTNGHPILILPEGALRTTGRNAQRNNIMAAKAVSDIVKTTLGPKGMDKMLVDDIGDIVITNDGATIVEEMNVEHPAAKMVVEVAKTQDEEVGDGTTTAVVLTGELLSSAEKLLDKGVHSTVISRGYKMAAEKSQEILCDIGTKISLTDEPLLKKIAETAMTGKGAEAAKEALADISVKAVKKVVVKEGEKHSVDRDDIQIEKKQGGSIYDSELIEGVVLDKERASDAMPSKVENPKILLLDVALEIKKTETDAKIRITSADQLLSFTQQEEKMLKEKADAVIKSGAVAVFCQKGMDDLVIHYLAKAGVFAVKNVSESNMKRLAKATGARVASNLQELGKEDLGNAKLVEEKKISGEEMIFVSGCKNPKSVSILVRGGTEHVVDEVERAVTDAVGGVSAALEMGSAVAGGGACEIELARQIREYAESISGREQLAINAFADALEIIPRTLAESAGMDSIDTLVKLRAEHEKKGKNSGVAVLHSRIEDMWKNGIIEPLKIKVQAIKSASEAAQMILRIDDVIASSKKSAPPMPPGGMGGMGEY